MAITFLPMLLWAVGSLMTARAVRHFGPAATNRWRLLIAVSVLGAWVLIGPGLPTHGKTWFWLLISGAVGLGLGDLAMLVGFRKIGTRLSVLLLLCLAVPITGLSEWLWLGTPMTGRAAALITLLLVGVAITVWPGKIKVAASGRDLAWGIGFGILAAAGQGLSTTISRVAYEAARADHVPLDGVVAAWQRMLGGLVCTLLAERLFRLSSGEPPMARAGETMVDQRGLFPGRGRRIWVVLSALCSPILGLSAYQWALIRYPGFLVQAVSTLTPVAVIPLAWWFDGDHPGWRGVIGGVLACAAAALLVTCR